MDIVEYFEALGHHDWTYNYSDDHRAWTKGLAESTRLQSIAQENTTLLRMYKDYADYIFNPISSPEKPKLEDYLS